MNSGKHLLPIFNHVDGAGLIIILLVFLLLLILLTLAKQWIRRKGETRKDVPAAEDALTRETEGEEENDEIIDEADETGTENEANETDREEQNDDGPDAVSLNYVDLDGDDIEKNKEVSKEDK